VNGYVLLGFIDIDVLYVVTIVYVPCIMLIWNLDLHVRFHLISFLSIGSMRYLAAVLARSFKSSSK
jgi:hypothetical protein